MIEIMIDLQGGAKAPLYEKIYEYIKSEITDGRIPRGERLPSTRLLAKNLAVSRSTVEMAYDQLLAEGYIKAEPCRGFFVCDITELYELGNIYIPKALPLTELPDEKMRLTLGMYGSGDFFDMKGVIEELTEKLGFAKEVSYEPTSEHPFLHPGRQANIMKGKLK